MNKNYYIYKTTNADTGEFYFGMRSCLCAPHLDIKYFGSGAWVAHVKKQARLLKSILFIANCKKQAQKIESKIIKENLGNDLMMNYQGNPGRKKAWKEISGQLSFKIRYDLGLKLKKMAKDERRTIKAVLERLINSASLENPL